MPLWLLFHIRVFGLVWFDLRATSPAREVEGEGGEGDRSMGRSPRPRVVTRALMPTTTATRSECQGQRRRTRKTTLGSFKAFTRTTTTFF
ncbi:hypothetical protein BDA96_02G441500 [Sorghum bicolor]|uniref:Secreted protein n=1 Tax=Sorghum bicolor TaxID=4558 RepID=A0A921RW55_SORBI|nr:hypothetical protein BDA96_02G441500 [Sorghum bicolor]